MLGHILKNYPQFKCTGLLNQFSERLLEVQSFHTHRNPRHMFFFDNKRGFFCKVYDLKPSTIFLLLRNFSSPSVCSSSLSTEFLYACSYLDSPSLCRRCHPQLFTPLFFLKNTLLKGLLQSGHVYELTLVNSFLEA